MAFGTRWHRVAAVAVAVSGALFLVAAGPDQPAPAQPPPQGQPAPEGQQQPAKEGKDPTQGSGMTVEGEGRIGTEAYTVKEGDTLWDISSRYLSNPWYWPKLWSYNPHISNPHWIYPGENINFYGGEEIPYQVEGKEPPAVSKGDVTGGLEVPDDVEGVTVAGSIKKFDGPTYVRRDSFVSAKEVQRAGEIIASFDEKIMLSIYDKAYFRFKDPNNVRIGDRFMVYEQPRPVYYPDGKKIAGYQVEIAGGAQVTKIDGDVFTAQFFVSFAPVRRGYHALPWVDDNYRKIMSRPAVSAVAGIILQTAVEDRTISGEHHIVFVDKGRDDGVVEGNTFHVVRRGDQLTSSARVFPEYANVKGLPWEDVGAIIVVDARDKVSTGIVTRAIRELVIGDRVETRVSAR